MMKLIIIFLMILLAPAIFAADVLVIWTAPGDDADSGTASQYNLRYSTALITESNFNSASQVAGIAAPAIAGTVESVLVTGLAWSTTYWITLKVADEIPNWSGMSNVVSYTTPTELDTIPPSTPVIQLGQNYPNPFGDYTAIPFWLPGKQHAKVEVFDILGRRLETILNERMDTGWHIVEWRPSFPSWDIFHPAAIKG